jgi:hypothetical protein
MWQTSFKQCLSRHVLVSRYIISKTSISGRREYLNSQDVPIFNGLLLHWACFACLGNKSKIGYVFKLAWTLKARAWYKFSPSDPFSCKLDLYYWTFWRPIFVWSSLLIFNCFCTFSSLVRMCFAWFVEAWWFSQVCLRFVGLLLVYEECGCYWNNRLELMLDLQQHQFYLFRLVVYSFCNWILRRWQCCISASSYVHKVYYLLVLLAVVSLWAYVCCLMYLSAGRCVA